MTTNERNGTDPVASVTNGGPLYFCWTEGTTADEFRAHIQSDDERVRLQAMGRLFREARTRDVWAFVTPQEVADSLDRLLPTLGRRRDFWRYIIGKWRELGKIN